MQQTKFPGVFERKGKRPMLLTRNLVPGRSVYQEKLFPEGNIEYREWDASKSKLAAAILKGVSQTGLKEGHTVLYLGCSTGTTVSHVSDIVGKGGFVYALDFAPRVMREMVFLSEDRPNIAPILADANNPDGYANLIEGKVDWVYQDIAQKGQAEIFLKNVERFLKPQCFCIIAVKARSIDVTRKPGDIFRDVQKKLESVLVLVDKRELSPFQLDHMFFVMKKR